MQVNSTGIELEDPDATSRTYEDSVSPPRGVPLPRDSDLEWEISLKRFLSEGKVIMGKYRKFTAEYRDVAVKIGDRDITSDRRGGT